MKKFKEFVKKNLKKFIVGGILAAVTLGGSVIYAIIKNHKGGES